MKYIILLGLLIGCGKLEHRGEVKVTVDITSSFIQEVCLGSLGLGAYELEDLTDEEMKDLRSCMAEKLQDFRC